MSITDNKSKKLFKNISTLQKVFLCAAIVGGMNFSCDAFAADFKSQTSLNNSSETTDIRPQKIKSIINKDNTTTLLNNTPLMFQDNKRPRNIKLNGVMTGAATGATITEDETTNQITERQIINTAKIFDYSIADGITTTTSNAAVFNVNTAGADFTLTNSIIKNSSVTREGTTTYAGIIHNDKATKIAIDNVIFSNNYAHVIVNSSNSRTANGGVLYLTRTNYDSTAPVTITNTTFDGNHAYSTATSTGTPTVRGGAIAAGASTSSTKFDLTIDNVIFRNNYASNSANTSGAANSYGGAIFFGNDTSGTGTKVIEDSDFINNYVTAENSGSGAAYGRGGAIYNGTTITLRAKDDNMLFQDNDALTQGGAIYNVSSGTINFETQNGHSINFVNPTASQKNDIQNLGTLIIAGDVNVQTDIQGTGNINLNSGTLYVKSLSQKTLNMASGSTLSFQEMGGDTPQYNSNTVTNLTGTGNLAIDVAMSNGSSDSLTVSNSSSANINLSSINVRDDYTGSSSTLSNYITYLNGTFTGSLTVGGNTGQLVVGTNTKTYTFTKGSDGKLNVAVNSPIVTNTLKDYIEGNTALNTFSFSENNNTNYASPVVTYNTTGNPLYVYMNGYELTGTSNSNGITVANGYTLNLDGNGATNSTVSNFSTAFTVNNGGTLNVSDTTFDSNTTAIANDGTLNLSGTNIFNSQISGSGTTTLSSGSTTLGADLTQGELNVSGGTLVNNANITATLSNAATITNSGSITTSGGSNSGSISGGTLNTSGTFTNTNSVSVANLNLSSGGVINAKSGSLNADAFSNDAQGGTLNLNGGTINSVSLGNASLNSALHLNLDNSASSIDSITLGGTSTGTFIVDSLSNAADLALDTNYRVLSGDAAGAELQLSSALSSLTKDKSDAAVHEADAKLASYTWNQQNTEGTGEYDKTVTHHYKLGVTSSSGTLKDTIAYLADGDDTTDKTYTSYYNLLEVVNNQSGSRTFTSDSATDTYTVNSSIGDTLEGSLTISGVKDGSNISTINFNSNSGFNLNSTSAAAVNLNNVKISNASNVATVSEGNTLALNTAVIDSSNSSGIENNGSLTLQGSNEINKAVSGSGTTTLSSGSTTLGADLTQGELNVSGGTLVNNANITATLSNAATITNSGSITTSGGSNSGSISGGTLNTSGTFTNTGSITNSIINILSGSTFTNNNTTDAIFNNTLNGDNTSVFNKDGSGKLTYTGNGSGFKGTVDIDNGTLAFNDSTGNFFSGDASYDLANNTTLEITNANALSLQNLSASSNTAKVDKYGTGNVIFAGDNSGYKGELDINAGKVSFANSSTNKYIAGNTVIDSGASLDYTTTISDTLKNVSGNGDLNKKGANQLTFNETENTFAGTVNVEEGKLVVQGKNNATGLAYNTVVKDGALEYTAGTDSTNIRIGGSATPNLSFNGAGSAEFKGLGKNVTTYILDTVTGMTDVNTVKISSSDIKLAQENYNVGKYAIEDSILDLEDDTYSSLYIKTIDLSGNNSIKIDVDLAPLPDSPKSDTIKFGTVTGTGALSIALNSINIHNDKANGDDGLHNNYTFNVIKETDGVTLSKEGTVTNWATNVYEYLVDITSDCKGIVLTKQKAADNNSLKAMNQKDGTRGFEFTNNDTNPYTIASSLGTTSAGTFTVTGHDMTVDGGNTNTLFEVTNATKLTVSDLTIENANGTNGPVANINNGSAQVEFNNVNLQNNTSTGDGGAINNTNSASLKITGGDMTGNSAGGNGGVINNTSTGATIEGITADNNSAKGNGGAIYTNKDLTITDSDFGVTARNTDSNGSRDNDIYIDGSSIVTYDTKTKDGTIASGLAGTGNLNKTGSNTLNLSGNNTDFTGNMNVQSGNVSFTQGKNTDTYISGSTSITSGSTVTINNSMSDITAGNFSGAGNVVKDGTNNLTLTGDNSGLTGTFDVQSGDVNFTQNTASDKYVGGTTNIASGSTVTLTNDLSDIIAGNFTGNGSFVKDGDKNLTLKGNNSNFTGDVTIDDGKITYNPDNSTYFGGNTQINTNGQLTVQGNNNATISSIAGTGTISNDGSGKLILSGDNSGFVGNLSINSGSFGLANGAALGTLNNAAFADGTSINLQNTTVVDNGDGTYSTNPNPASIEKLNMTTITLNGKVGFAIDVDLKNSIADSINATNVSGSGYLSISQSGLNVVSDALLNNTSVTIAQGQLATNGYIKLEDSAKSVMGPIQRYDVTYGGGVLNFAKQGGNTPGIDSINMAVMPSVVATQAGGYLAQLETLHDGFFHLERYTRYTLRDRKTAEDIALNASTDTPVYLYSNIPETSQAMWIKPYTTFENIPLKGGIDVSTITYGSLYGGDSELKKLGHGWMGVLSAFVGYNGANQSFNGISMTQEGGVLGFTGTAYKGNFFTGLTVSTGASAGQAYTQYGRDDYAMLTAGVANKTGYNIEFNGGKFIIQPSLFLGYTFVNTFDYTNAAGVRINSDPLNAIQVIPGVKFIGNLADGWQPYIGINMVWNIMNKNKVMANDVRLPQVSVKPYVEYGVGVQRSWKDRFTAYFQAMVRNGGRNGIAFTAGFRWLFGDGGKSKSKANKPQEPPKKTVIKEFNRTNY